MSADDRELLHGKRILIVDDHPLNIFALESALNALLEVRTAAARSGGEALTLLARDPMPADIVLMDMMMPDLDGYETTRRIRASGRPALERLTIIAVTARATLEDRDKCLAAGVSDYITKPVDIHALIAMMARHCLPAAPRR